MDRERPTNSADEGSRPDGPSLPVVSVLGILVNPLRVDVLRSMADRRSERSVTELARSLELDHSTVSRNLQVFRQAGLAIYRPHKKRHLYRLSENVEITILPDGCRITIPCRDGKVILEFPHSGP